MIVELYLKSSKTSCFGREFCPTFDKLYCLKERSSAVRTPNFGEMKRRTNDDYAKLNCVEKL